MKTCKDFNIELCAFCRDGSIYVNATGFETRGCIMLWFEAALNDSPDKKRMILDTMTWKTYRYLEIMLKEYYPDWYSYSQKMLVLK